MFTANESEVVHLAQSEDIATGHNAVEDRESKSINKVQHLLLSADNQ